MSLRSRRHGTFLHWQRCAERKGRLLLELDTGMPLWQARWSHFSNWRRRIHFRVDRPITRELCSWQDYQAGRGGERTSHTSFHWQLNRRDGIWNAAAYRSRWSKRPRTKWYSNISRRLHNVACSGATFICPTPYVLPFHQENNEIKGKEGNSSSEELYKPYQRVWHVLLCSG